jgi:hypothetical protein
VHAHNEPVSLLCYRGKLHDHQRVAFEPAYSTASAFLHDSIP